MSELFIDYTKDPLLEELTRDYRALEAVNARALEKIADVKHTRGQRLDRKHPDARLILERERAHEVAILRLQLAAGDLLAAVQQLHVTRAKVAAGLKDFDSYSGMAGLAENNLLCADALCDAAARTFYSQARRELAVDFLARHCSAIHRLYSEPDPSADPREFVLTYSGHGSGFRFDVADAASPPPPPYLTLSEAKAEAAHWSSISCTIGGDAEIYNVRTKEVIRRWY